MGRSGQSYETVSVVMQLSVVVWDFGKLREKLRSRLTDIENKLVVTSGRWGDNIGVEDWEAQTIGCKIGSRKYCTTWRI